MRHLLYFGGYRMRAFRWEGGAFTGLAEFEPDETGFDNFRKFLVREVKYPVRLLADIIEEDFRVDMIPSVYGRDREAVRDRAIKKHFRKYSYTHIETQGREEKGRRDVIALMSALTNFDLFNPWFEILNSQKIAVQGIYTLPLVGELLLKHLNVKSRRALIISQQVPSSIRESFYQDGKLKLSRLAPSVDDEKKRYKVLRDETERTIKFLENQHYVSREGLLDVYIIAHGSEHSQIANLMSDDNRVHYHLIDKDHLAAHMGIKTVTPGGYCDWIYAHLLLTQRRLQPHYGTYKEKKYYYHHLAKKSMTITSAALISLAVIFAGIVSVNTQTLLNEEPQLKAETVKYNALYEDTISQISSLKLDVQDVRQAVDIVNDIKEKYGHLPLGMVSALSKELTTQNKIILSRLQWVATYDENHSMGEVKSDDNKGRDVKRRNRASSRTPSTLYEKILLEAAVIDFENNPRIAIEYVSNLVEALRLAKAGTSISIIKMPYDIDSDSRFTREARVNNRGTEKNAVFSILLVQEHKAL